MTDLIVDGQVKQWDGVTDFGVWLADQLPLEFIHAQVSGDHTTSVGLDLTKRRKGHTLDLTRLKLTAKGCPAAIDMTDSAGIRVVGGIIVGDEADPPRVGVLQSRCSEEQWRSAGGHVLYGVSIVGHFLTAALGNLGAETVWYDHLRLDNKIGYALALCFRNTLGFVSSWRTADNQRTATVASIDCLDAQAQSLVLPGILVHGFDRADFSGLTSIASPFAGVCVDTSASGVVGPTIANLYARAKSTPSGQLPKAAMLYRGPAGNGIISHRVVMSQGLPSVGAQKPIVVEGKNSFRHCEWVHHETTQEDWGQATFQADSPSKVWRRGEEKWLP
jgi:hypothetical protein